MFKRLIFLAIIVLFANHSFAGIIVVSKSEGKAKGDGSTENPCLIITQAIQLAKGGDVIYVKDGIFRETVRITKSNITITTNNKDVFITGTDLITGFTNTGNGIYKSYVPNEVTQLFVDGIPQVKAKYPNQDVDTNLFNFTTIKVNFAGTTITSNEITQPNGFFTGATVWMLTGHRWVAGTAKITKHTGNILELSNVSFNYQGDGIAFISNCKNCLDNNGEWYWGNDTLYYKNSEIDIANYMVEAKTRETLFDIEKAENIKINGVNGYAGNILFNQTKACKISDGNFKYLTDYNYLKRQSSYARGVRAKITSYGLGVAMFGVGDTISKCNISWSAGDCVTLFGTKNIVLRSTIHDGNYRATDCGAVTIGGSQNQILRCEIYNAGRDLISAAGATQFKILYNKLYRAGLVAWDLGVIYTYGTDGKESEIAYNHVSEGYSENPEPHWGAVGIYLDNGSKNFIVHHNVIFNIKGSGLTFNDPGVNLRAYNNTVFNTIRGMIPYHNGNFKDIKPRDCKLYNNYFDEGNKDIEWIAAESNVITKSDYLKDRKHNNYAPLPASELIDKGVIIDELKNITFAGNAPDIGAYEFGEIPWEVGPLSNKNNLQYK